MRIGATVLLTIMVLVLIGVLGHSVWHDQVIFVLNAITIVFAGGHAVS